MSLRTIRCVAVAALAMLTAGCSQKTVDDVSARAGDAAPSPELSETRGVAINPRLLRRFQPLPKVFDDGKSGRTSARVDLGRMLYYEPRLSKSGGQSCNSCHLLADYGVDHESFSPGESGRRGSRNAPTVYGAAGLFVQFWDGRAPNVEEQAKGPMLNPAEMAMADGAQVVAALRAVPGYAEAFRLAFPDETEALTFDNVGRAIGAFERGLVAPSRWDEFLGGNESALSAEEKGGLKTFLNVGCMVCHTGALLGGSMFERAGVVEPWPNQRDRGREQVTHAAGDGMMFKVPTLRNVARTAPYFHDASAATLPEAVRMMGRYQLGLDLSEDEVTSIVTWLNALTGDLPRDYIAPPALPPGKG